MRCRLGYSDVMFDQTYNNSFQQGFESLQYKATLTVTGVIKCSSTEKLFWELELESIKNRLWFQKLGQKETVMDSPKYLIDLIPSSNNSYQTRNNLKRVYS